MRNMEFTLPKVLVKELEEKASKAGVSVDILIKNSILLKVLRSTSKAQKNSWRKLGENLKKIT